MTGEWLILPPRGCSCLDSFTVCCYSFVCPHLVDVGIVLESEGCSGFVVMEARGYLRVLRAGGLVWTTKGPHDNAC